MGYSGGMESTVSTDPEYSGPKQLHRETGDPRWLDPEYYRRMAGPYRAAQFRKQRADEETKRRRKDRMFMYLRRMLNNARKNSARRGQDCTITEPELWALLESSGRACQVTRVPFDLAPHANGRSPFAPSLDRIDGRRGYTKGNVRLVVQIANLAMNVWDAETLRDFLSKANR